MKMDDQAVYQLFESPLFADLKEQDQFDHLCPVSTTGTV
jgi:hypothetical protein